MRKKISLLVTCVGGTLSASILNELRKSKVFDYRLIGVNATSSVAAQNILDAFFIVPLGDDPEYVPSILEIIRKEKVDVVLPGSDEEAFACSSAMGTIEALGARAIVSSPDCLTRIANKHTTYECLKDAGVKVPEYSVVHDSNGLGKALDLYGYPRKTVITKPSKGRGGRGLYVLCGSDDPPLWLGSGKREVRIEPDAFHKTVISSLISGETMVMPCLKTPAYDADVLRIKGDRYIAIVRRRNNPTGIPFEGNRIIADDAIHDYCQRIASVLGLKALHDIDLMTDDEGNPVVIEVNPRPSGSIAATMAAGFPIIDWAVGEFLGINIETFEPKKDIEIISSPCVFAVLNN